MPWSYLSLLRQLSHWLPMTTYTQELSSFFIFQSQKCSFSYLSWSVQFSSVAQSCPTLCHLIDCSTPGFPVHHQLPELAHTHVHRVGDAIQPGLITLFEQETQSWPCLPGPSCAFRSVAVFCLSLKFSVRNCFLMSTFFSFMIKGTIQLGDWKQKNILMSTIQDKAS